MSRRRMAPTFLGGPSKGILMRRGVLKGTVNAIPRGLDCQARFRWSSSWTGSCAFTASRL
jgi:hypothetical protein